MDDCERLERYGDPQAGIISEALAEQSSDGLLACRKCSADCRVQDFSNEISKARLWLCAKSTWFGGKCDEDAYLSKSAWNTRALTPEQLSPLSDGVVAKIAAIRDSVDAFNPDARMAARSLFEAQEALWKLLPDIFAALSRPSLAPTMGNQGRTPPVTTAGQVPDGFRASDFARHESTLADSGIATDEGLAATLAMRLAETDLSGPVPDDLQSDIRMAFNEAIAGGPNINGDAGPTLDRNHAYDCVHATDRILALTRTLADERNAAEWFVRRRKSIENDVSSAHSARGAGAASWMREDDADFRRDLRDAFDRLEASLSQHPTDREGQE